MHYYNKGELKLPSVTTIESDCTDKSQALCQWSANMVCEWIKQKIKPSCGEWTVTEEDLDKARMNYREVSKDALDIGSTVHAAIEEWLKTGNEPKDPRPEVLSAFLAFLEFFDAHNMETIEVEFTVYGDYWAGTLDLYCEFNGKRYVIDFKTSKAHYPNEMGPQIAAYRSRVNDKVDGCGILRLDKITGYPDWKDYSKRYIRDLEHFSLMVPLYMHRHPMIARAAGWHNRPF